MTQSRKNGIFSLPIPGKHECDSADGFRNKTSQNNAVQYITDTYLDGIGQGVHSLEHSVAAIDSELDFFAHESQGSGIVVGLPRDGSEAGL